MRKLKIGYFALSSDLKAPGDRRRLAYWARNRGHELLLGESKQVDVIVVTENTDFNSSHFKKNDTPVVFDLIDAYLSPKSLPDDLGRGIAKKIAGQLSGSIQPFSHHIRDFCQRSNAVICSSTEQQIIVKNYNTNTHVILDSHHEFPFLKPKLEYQVNSRVIKVLWEGQPATLPAVKQVAPILSKLADIFDTEFTFVTDPTYFMYLNRFIKKNTYDLLPRNYSILRNKMKIIPWSGEHLSNFAQKSSLAIIPVNTSIPIQRLKPENRLLIMWRLGLPCLTSASPAFIRTANTAGVRAVCQTQVEWLQGFKDLISNPDFAFEEVVRGQNYLYENHSEEQILAKWDRALESVVS